MTEERLKVLNRVKKRIRLTIGTKLVGLVASLLISSVTGIVWQSTRMFTEDNTDLIRQMNADTAAILATQMREIFESTTNRMRTFGTVLIQEIADASVRDHIVGEFFQDKDYLAVAVHAHADDGTTNVVQRIASPEMKGINDPDAEKAFATVLSDKNFSLAQVAKGEVQLAIVKLADNSPALAIAMPFIQATTDRFSHSVIAIIRQSKFVKAFSEMDSVTSYMVDRHGRLLAHPDASRVAAGENAAHLEIVKELMKGQFNNSQMRYFEGSANEGKGEWRLGAFRMVGFGGLGIVAEVPEIKAFDASVRVKYRSIWIAGIILAISFFAGFVYSGTITGPVRLLVEASERIAQGDFKIGLPTRGNDELAHLSKTFNEMAKGLEERDRVKETFNKFHNKEIAEKLLSGEVKLGGERREATIFFSDVRGFTGMSESMEPEQVVEMLNEYMTRMVAIIRQYGGIVDKYVGDAIMAIWGVPLSQPDDAVRAIHACVAMRRELAALNELRLSRNQPVLKIGMGVNTGPVIAGNIGSTEKMEYTVIGDSVNLASRIESMTKEYGTDLLISKNVHELVKERFVFENCRSARVKGKSEAIEIFKVLGYIDDKGGQVIVQTPYSSYEAEKSDKAVHEQAKPEEQPVITVAAETPVIVTPVAEVSSSAPSPTTGSEPTVAEMIDQIPIPNPFAKPAAAPVSDVAVVAEEKTDPQLEVPPEAVAPVVEAETPTSPSIQAPTQPPREWFIQAEGQTFGPFTQAEIHCGIATAELTADMVAAPEMQDASWQPLGQWPEFQNHFKNQPKTAA